MRKPRTPLHQKRWTLRLFEWGVLVCVILILMGVFLRKIRYLQTEAERLNVQAMVENMRAVVLMASVLHQDRETVSTALRPGGNPAALLKAETGLVPTGYLGDLDETDLAQIAPGSWYFDRAGQALIYLLRSAEGFTSPLAGPARIRLCISAADGGQSGDPPLLLKACEPYRWQPIK